jgi:hypothetical protein
MKRSTVRILVIVCALTILPACSTMDATDNSQQVTDVAAKIADFDPPTGYTPEFTAQMLGYTLAAYKGSSGPSHLYFVQSEKKADGEELERMLAQLAPGSSDSNTRLTVVENHPVTIRGQEATLVISEGTNHEGESYRQATVSFQGKGGPALLVFSDSVNNWDQDAIDAFLQSIE